MIRRPVRDAGGSRLTGRDLLRVGSLGLRSRRVRAVLSALGISIGIAAIVGVLGISQSSKTGLLNELGSSATCSPSRPAAPPSVSRPSCPPPPKAWCLASGRSRT